MASLDLIYQCTVWFFAGSTMEALLHHECPGLELIGKYLAMSNINIYSEVHIHWRESLQFFCWHAFPAICSLQALLLEIPVGRLLPILKLWHLTTNKLGRSWCQELNHLLGRRAPRRTGVYDQIEQLFTSRKFHFCSHRNFRYFFPKWKAPGVMYLRGPFLILNFVLFCFLVLYITNINDLPECLQFTTRFAWIN